jgi:preprotein translocase subunit SecA
MRLFAGDWVAGVLRRLGLEEDQSISSRMVSRRVEAAQGRVAKLAATDQRADSADEWLRLNCPGLAQA